MNQERRCALLRCRTALSASQPAKHIHQPNVHENQAPNQLPCALAQAPTHTEPNCNEKPKKKEREKLGAGRGWATSRAWPLRTSCAAKLDEWLVECIVFMRTGRWAAARRQALRFAPNCHAALAAHKWGKRACASQHHSGYSPTTSLFKLGARVRRRRADRAMPGIDSGAASRLHRSVPHDPPDPNDSQQTRANNTTSFLDGSPQG